MNANLSISFLQAITTSSCGLKAILGNSSTNLGDKKPHTQLLLYQSLKLQAGKSLFTQNLPTFILFSTPCMEIAPTSHIK